MWWESSSILIYQFMWYAPGTGKGAAGPCIGTICYPSTLTWGRAKQMNLKRESKITPLQLQCHLQTTFIKTVQIDLLLLDVALEPPGTNFPGGIEILGCQQAPGQLASGMHGLTCVSVYSFLLVCTSLSGEVQCRTHFADCKICSLNTTHSSIPGNSLDITPKVDSWVGKGVDQRTFGPIATPLPVLGNPR